jgi:hypothetical protein
MATPDLHQSPREVVALAVNVSRPGKHDEEAGQVTWAVWMNKT